MRCDGWYYWMNDPVLVACDWAGKEANEKARVSVRFQQSLNVIERLSNTYMLPALVLFHMNVHTVIYSFQKCRGLMPEHTRCSSYWVISWSNCLWKKPNTAKTSTDPLWRAATASKLTTLLSVIRYKLRLIISYISLLLLAFRVLFPNWNGSVLCQLTQRIVSLCNSKLFTVLLALEDQKPFSENIHYSWDSSLKLTESYKET